MLFTKRMFMVLGTTASVLAATADGTATMPESFESATVGAAVTTLTGWDGYGTIQATESQSLAAGVPIAGAHTKHLAVEGYVTATFDETGTTQDRVLEMLVKVSLPEDDLEAMDDTDAKFALAIDSTGKLNYWTGSAWAVLKSTVYAENQWIRIALSYDKANQKCKVTVDGDVAMNGDTPWFNVLKTTTTLSSIKVSGSTAIDDVVLTKQALADYTPSYKDPTTGEEITQTDSEVTLSWLDKNNLPKDQDVTTTTGDTSGLTYEQKYVLGNEVKDNKKFMLKNITMIKDGETVKAKITVPDFGTVAAGYTAKLQTKTSGPWTDSGVTVTPGAEITIPLSSGSEKVTKFRVIVTK